MAETWSNYVEFLDICHFATCDDVCLMEGFWCGLDEDLCFVMTCWTLEGYINFALWMNGSALTLGEVEDDSSLIQPHLTDVVQQDPEHSPLIPLATDMTIPESTDRELPPAVRSEPVTTVPTNAPEPKPQRKSNQGCEPATRFPPEGILVETDSGEDWLIDWDTEILSLLGSVARSKVVVRDTSKTAWGTLSNGRIAFGSWTPPMSNWYNFKEFQPELRGHHVLVHSDNMTVVVFINHQGGLSSP